MDLFDLPTHLPNSEPVAKEPQEVDIPVELDSGKDPIPVTDKAAEPEETIEEESITIQGTNIKLETKEDIEKWIQDRKKNWPSKQNVERKRALDQGQHQDQNVSNSSNTNGNPPAKRTKTICKFYQNNKSCRYGKNCKNLHQDNNTKVINNVKTSIPNRFENKRDNSLFKMLVKNDHLQENLQFIDFLKYLDSKGLINHDLKA